MSGMVGWNRVMMGLHKVTQTALKSASDESIMITTKLIYHSLDMLSHISKPLQSSTFGDVNNNINTQQHQPNNNTPTTSSSHHRQQQQQQQRGDHNNIYEEFYHQYHQQQKDDSIHGGNSSTKLLLHEEPQRQQQNVGFANIIASGSFSSLIEKGIKSLDNHHSKEEGNNKIEESQHPPLSTTTMTNDDSSNINNNSNNIQDGNNMTIQNNNIDKMNQIRIKNDDEQSTDNTKNEMIWDDIQHIATGKPVPATRIGRAFGFAQLGMNIAVGTAIEGMTRMISGTGGDGKNSSNSNSLIMNDRNTDQLAITLCRMRGAALKMGQMLSIQDETLLPNSLVRALNRVRSNAEAMPEYQLINQLEKQLGKEWKNKFIKFDIKPFAAASIGQVHHAIIYDDIMNKEQHVAVKVQYPGVAQSISSDLRNLSMIIKYTGLVPKGLFLDNVIRVGEKELISECNYINEMNNQIRMKSLLENNHLLCNDHLFYIPNVYSKYTTNEIITTEYVTGSNIDHGLINMNQNERNRIGKMILYITMQELFVWRFMQTDPNWGNFLYDVNMKRTSMIDFGATREYTKDFVDGYLRIVWASANRNKDSLLEQSYRMKFLTGEENEQMINAHISSGYTVGEPFYDNDDIPFDFQKSNISTRMSEHTTTFLKYRLTPPPEEVYTLHRKLAGAYMLCIKLGSIVSCRDMLVDIVKNHIFTDGLSHPME